MKPFEEVLARQKYLSECRERARAKRKEDRRLQRTRKPQFFGGVADMPFTPEELAEMAAADAEIEASFRLEREDLERARKLDREAHFEALPYEKRKVAAQRKAYREANREKYNAYMRKYMREYQRRRRHEPEKGEVRPQH